MAIEEKEIDSIIRGDDGELVNIHFDVNEKVVRGRLKLCLTEYQLMGNRHK